MLIRIICGIVISACTWYAGREYSLFLGEKIKRIDGYIELTEKMHSAVSYSGKSILQAFEESAGEYKDGKDEYATVIENVLKRAECSNDAQSVAAMLAEAKDVLLRKKHLAEEEYRGKIKTSPAIGLMTGMFIAVLIV